MRSQIIPDEAQWADIAIVGKKGRGKSYAAKGVVERLLDRGERVLVLDPLGHCARRRPSSCRPPSSGGSSAAKLAGERLGREGAFREFASALDRTQGILSGTIGDLVSVAQTLGLQGLEKAQPAKTVQLAAISDRAPSKERGPRLPVPESVTELTAAAEEFLATAIKIAPALMSWGQLGVLCRRKAHGGSFKSARKQLLVAAYVIEVRNLVQVQSPGFAYLGEQQAAVAPTIEALIAQMIDALPTPAKEILAELEKAKSPMTA